CLQSLAAHRALRSFPTRRSSDLGLEGVSSGKVTVAGTPLAGMSEDALARFRRDAIGIVFQSFHLIATMTALENVAVPLEFKRTRSEEHTSELQSRENLVCRLLLE